MATKSQDRNSFWLCVCLIYTAPLALDFGSVGANPVLFAISNLALLYPLTILRKKSIHTDVISTLIYPFYFILFGIFISILKGGSVSTLFSMASFTLPILHIFVGACFASNKKNMNFSYAYFGYAIIILTFILFASDLMFGSFPRGCGYEGRWGGCIGRLEVYGFPNASMNYLAVASVFLGVFITRTTKIYIRNLAILSLLMIGFIVLLSLSRSAVLVYFISLSFIAFARWGPRVLFVIIILALLIIFFINDILNSFVISGLINRMQSALDSGDITTGRIGIWKEALILIYENPLFGKGFEAFSNFSDYGTAHQQFIEVLYKVGAFGFFIYFFPLAKSWVASMKYFRKKSQSTSVSDKILANGFVTCVLAASLFQPAISYQTLGNIIYFSAGYFIIKSKGKLKIQHETNSSKSLKRSIRARRSSRSASAAR